MTNPFENPNAKYHVLRNEEGQYSLWPAFLDIPRGWELMLQEEEREKCLKYVHINWDISAQAIAAKAR